MKIFKIENFQNKKFRTKKRKFQNRKKMLQKFEIFDFGIFDFEIFHQKNLKFPKCNFRKSILKKEKNPKFQKISRFCLNIFEIRF